MDGIDFAGNMRPKATPEQLPVTGVEGEKISQLLSPHLNPLPGGEGKTMCMIGRLISNGNFSRGRAFHKMTISVQACLP
jgi:hypothetical protein